jgi:hypothetical protein
LRCPISTKKFVEPVRTSIGIIYDKDALEQFLRDNPDNPFCPFYEKPLNPKKILIFPEINQLLKIN